MAEIEEAKGDARIWLPNIDGFFIPLVDYWNGSEGERNTASREWPFHEKRYEIPLSNKVEEMSDFNTYERPSRSIWFTFTDVTRVSEGHGYSSYYDEFPLKDSFKLLDSIWCFFRNVGRLQKFNYVCIRAWTYYKIGPQCVHVWLTSPLACNM